MMLSSKKMLLIGGLVVLLSVAGFASPEVSANIALMNVSYLGRNGPRGVRNNNPGNIRISSSPWQGKVSVSQNTDGAFEQFTTFVMGVRAMAKLLINYIDNGHNTITKIISRYAPAADNNNEERYVNHVVSQTGISAHAPLNNGYEHIKKLVIAMARHENGQDAVSNDFFNLAWTLI